MNNPQKSKVHGQSAGSKRDDSVSGSREDSKDAAAPKISIGPKFANAASNMEDRLKTETIGLYTKEDFKKTRERLQKESHMDDADDTQGKKLKRACVSTLSFQEEEEEESIVPIKIPKNPSVKTDFLPDRDREKQLRLEKERLKVQFFEEQERMKKEPLEIYYDFFDGVNHRKSLVVVKGCTIEAFLREVIKQSPDILVRTGVDDLVFVKEDVIIPSHYTFYDIIATKATSKTGPIWDFSVSIETKSASDRRIDKLESHAPKVVLRDWYDRNKHIYPASKWEVYNPNTMGTV